MSADLRSNGKCCRSGGFAYAAVFACIDNPYTLTQYLYIDCVSSVAPAMRDAAINLRARPEQRDLIDQAASLLGKNRSDFMLEAACDTAQAVLLHQVFFKLDAAKFKQFTNILDAPPTPNTGLKRLMAIEPRWANKKARS